MNKILFLIPLAAGAACAVNAAETQTSPDGRVKVEFALTQSGEPTYAVTFDGEQIIKPSEMGFRLKDAADLDKGFKLVKMTHDSKDETWTPVWGENSTIIDNCNIMTVELTQPASKRRMDIEFRVYDDGVGFRYILPDKQKGGNITITDELTRWAMGGDYTAWWIPGDYDTQEYEYTKSKLSEIRGLSTQEFMDNVSSSRFSPTGVQTSLMLKTPSGKYVNLHEAQLIDFPAMHLDLNDTTPVSYTHLTLPTT